MATTLPSPQFTTFFTNEEIEETRRDIALLSFLLAQVTHGDDKKDSGHKSPARPKLDAIQPWAYLAFMLTGVRIRELEDVEHDAVRRFCIVMQLHVGIRKELGGDSK